MFTIASRRDGKIIAQVLAGYHDQFGLLVQRYLPVVQAIAHARVRNPSDVDDVAQETFLTAFQNLDQLRERGKFPAWLAVITRNSATAILKQRSRDAAIAGTIQSETHIETPDFARRELRSAVRERIEQLDADAREVLLLYYFAGESCREIARILEASEPAVRKRLQRAREALGERILADFRKDDALAALLPERVKHILAAVLASGAAWSKESAAAAIGASAVASGAVLTGGFTLGKSLALAASVIAVAGAAFFVTQQEQAIEPSPVTSQSDSANQQSPVQPDPRNAIADSSADASLAIAMRPTGATIDRQSNASAIVPAPTGILVTGKILHSDGTPVPNATVYGGYWGHEPRREKMETTSDENGAYALYLDKPWEVFLVYGEKEGYARFRSIEVDVPETGAGDVDFTLYREATIEGYIDGRFPVSVAQKPITAFNHDADNILWTVSAESDETGAFTLTGLIPGSYSLAIVAQHDFDPDMENLRIDVHEGDHLTGIEVPYSGDGLVIAGRVTDEDGNPLKGAFVQATGAQGGWNSRYTYTDEEGKYRLVQLDEGEFPLTAHHQKYQYAHAVAEAGSENVDFVLRHHGSVSGRVVDARTRQPITEFEVNSIGGAQSKVSVTDERGFESFFDDQGRFTIYDVHLDTATVMARAKGYTPAFQLVELYSGQHLEGLVIELSPGLSVEGRVLTNAGLPVEGAYIVLGSKLYVPQGMDPKFYARQTAEVAQAISDSDGFFTVTDLAPGSQLLSAYHPDLGAGSATAFTPKQPGGGPLEIVLARGGAIRGAVTLGGAPQANLPVMVTAVGGFGMPIAQGKSNAQGLYELSGIPPGAVSVTAVLPIAGEAAGGRRLQRTALVVDEGEVVVDLDFPADYGSIVGRVEVDGVTEISGSAICTVPLADGEEMRMASIRDGQFQFDQVPTGTAELTVSIIFGDPSAAGHVPGGLSRTVPASVVLGQTTEVFIRFEGQSSVTGSILGVQSTGYGSVMVLDETIDVPEFDITIFASLMKYAHGFTQTAYDGTYILKGLDAGTYTLLATATQSNGPDFAENARFATTTVTLGAGETATVDFDLR